MIPKDLLVKVDKKSKDKKDTTEKNPDQPEPAGPFYHLKETPTKKPGPGPITIVIVLIVVVIAVFLFIYFARQLRLEQAALFGQWLLYVSGNWWVMLLCLVLMEGFRSQQWTKAFPIFKLFEGDSPSFYLYPKGKNSESELFGVLWPT